MLKKNNIMCFLIFLKNKNINFQKIKTALKSEKIIFYYFIPFFETKHLDCNLLLIGLKNYELKNFDYLFKNYSFLENYDLITEYLIENIEWDETDLLNHYLYWDDDNQIIVSSYLDFICGGLVTLLPETWNN